MKETAKRMGTPMPNVSTETRYSAAETADLLGIHRNTLRIYREKGFIRAGWQPSTMRIFYTGREILKFWNSYL